jgi:hypothetical protein
LTIALIGGVFFGLVRGCSEVVVATTNREPAQYTVRDYVKDRPGKKWLHLTDADVNLLRASYFSKFDVVETIYIPILPVDAEDKETPVVLLQTERPELLKVAEDVSKMNGEAEVLMYLLKNRETIDLGDSVQGLVGQFGDVDSDVRDDLKKLNPAIGNDFVVIIDGVKPSIGRGLLGLAMSAGCFISLIVILMIAGSGDEEGAEDAGGAAPPPIPGS